MCIRMKQHCAICERKEQEVRLCAKHLKEAAELGRGLLFNQTYEFCWNSCKKPFEKKEVNDYGRCGPCEATHKAWREGKRGLRDTTLNQALQRRAIYKKEIDSGVKGRDLIQPYNNDGSPSYDFLETYGDKAFDGKEKEKIHDKYGKG
jgi:hypothetical protein